MVGGNEEGKARDDKAKKRERKVKRKEIIDSMHFIIQIKMISLVVTKTVWMKMKTHPWKRERFI